MKVVWIIVGGVLVVVALADAVSTLVTTRTRKGRWWPTAAFYRLAWPSWRKVGQRIKDLERRERMLGAFGPVSLLCLLVIWVGLEIIGWGFVWYGLRASFEGIDSVIESWYFSGVNFFTVGFGDILPLSGWTRILAVCSAFTGVITTALVVGFLPTLYSAYSDREAELLTVDDLSGTYVTAIGLIELNAPDGDVTALYRRFEEWERWVARVIQSHTAYRMLVMFRSRRAGQSWLAGLGIVTDTAVTLLASVRGQQLRAPLLLYRRATELVAVLSDEFNVRRDLPNVFEIEEEEFRRRYERLGALGFQLRPFDEAWATMSQLREGYVPQLLEVSWALLAPVRFRNPEVRYPDVLDRLRREDAAPDA